MASCTPLLKSGYPACITRAVRTAVALHPDAFFRRLRRKSSTAQFFQHRITFGQHRERKRSGILQSASDRRHLTFTAAASQFSIRAIQAIAGTDCRWSRSAPCSVDILADVSAARPHYQSSTAYAQTLAPRTLDATFDFTTAQPRNEHIFASSGHASQRLRPVIWVEHACIAAVTGWDNRNGLSPDRRSSAWRVQGRNGRRIRRTSPRYRFSFACPHFDHHSRGSRI